MHKVYMVFEVIYLLRSAVEGATQDKVYIHIKSLRDVIFKELLEEDNIVIYPSEAELYEDLQILQKMSFITINGDRIIINKKDFLNATKFVVGQEKLLKNDRYATAILEKLRQRAQRIQLLQQESQ